MSLQKVCYKLTVFYKLTFNITKYIQNNNKQMIKNGVHVLMAFIFFKCHLYIHIVIYSKLNFHPINFLIKIVGYYILL